MFTEKDLRRWLSLNYPELKYKKLQSGQYGIYQEVYSWIPYEYQGQTFKSLDVGLSTVFVIRNRLLGGWIKEEIYSRDPKLKHNAGNVYYQGYIASINAEREREARETRARSKALEGWDIAKRNHALMNRVAKKLTAGDAEGAAREMTLPEIAKHAYKENPKEMRNRDFIRAVTSK